VTDIVLRRAGAADAYALWLWANDDATRAASRGRAVIPWSEHVRWLGTELAAGSAAVYIGERDALPVGSVRFDSPDGWRTARLSYVVAPESRGAGLSPLLVAQGVMEIRRHWPAVRLRAEVSPDNGRSLRVFRGLGWRESAPDAGGDVLAFWLD
jgi:RimJ/RimL family protein N-acetyltransferase